jgi:flagellar biosynthesis/type III secretory pathway protein FliH
MTSDAASEDGSSPQAQPDTTLGLDNEAVTQLIEAAREQARVDAHAAGFQEGLEAGLEQATSEMQAKIDEKLAAMDLVMKGLHQLERDPDALFEPMKKLAMHLAQQLVRGELTQSGQVIARLVDNCLRELAASGEKAVIIHLHPDDLEQYKPLIAQFGDSIVCRPDGLLSRGSVRASLDGSVVEDMIERRVKGLTKSLAQPVASSWRPALPTPSTKPKSNVAAQPAVMATPDTTIKADELEHDHDDEEIIHDNDDDAMIDAMIDASTMDNSDQIHADRNDETNS